MNFIITMCVEDGIEGVAVELLAIKNMLKNSNCLIVYNSSDGVCSSGCLNTRLREPESSTSVWTPVTHPWNVQTVGTRKPKTELPLNVRVYHCHLCGLMLDRDVNAAINVLIRGFGERFRVGGRGSSPLRLVRTHPLGGAFGKDSRR